MGNALQIGQISPFVSTKMQENTQSWPEKEGFLSILPSKGSPLIAIPPLSDATFQSPFFGFLEGAFVKGEGVRTMNVWGVKVVEEK